MRIKQRGKLFFGVLLAGCVLITAAAEPPMWLRQNLSSDPAKAPTVDGILRQGGSHTEYAQGRWFPLSNWMGDGALNGKMFMQIQGSLGSPMPFAPRAVFVGLMIPRKLNASAGAYDNGSITIYIEGDRLPWTALRTGWPTPDRKIQIDFLQPNANFDPYGPVDVYPHEYRAMTSDGLSLDELFGENRYFQVASMAPFDADFLFLELRIDLPQTVFDDGRLGFALVYRDEGYANNLPVFTVPNIRNSSGNNSINFYEKSGWADLHVVEPLFSKLGVSIYNSGQMVAAAHAKKGDGGDGEPKQIARAIYSRDLVCLTEVMLTSERDEIFAYANKMRAAQTPPLPPFRPYVDGEQDEPPNNMIVTSWRVARQDSIRFSTLGCDHAPDDNVGAFPFPDSPRGSKGIVYARIAAPICGRTGLPPDADPQPCAESDIVDSPDEFFDVFCLHTQADNDYDGQHSFHRNCQFQKLKRWMDAKRSDAMDRPAIILGDMNQVGPKGLSDNEGQPVGQQGPMNTWLTESTDIYATGGTSVHDLKVEYRKMRETLGNYYPHKFDAANDQAIEDYDISANTAGDGSWIGQENSMSTSATTSGDCTPGVPGYPNMRLTPRVDYIMLAPPDANVWPAWAFRFDPAYSPRAFVSKHSILDQWAEWYGSTVHSMVDGSDGDGCVSDHGEVTAYLQPLRIGQTPAYNPTKSHYVSYRVTQLNDVFGNDGEWTDWYGYTGVKTPAGVVDNHWSDDHTPDKISCDPNWRSVSHLFTGFEEARTSTFVMDWDGVNPNDHYDGDTVASCKNPEFIVQHASGDIFAKHCGYGAPQYVGNMKAVGGVFRGPMATTRGGGDGYTVEIQHEIRMCELGTPVEQCD